MPPTGTAEAADGAGGDTIVLPKGRVLIDAYLEMSLDSGAVFKPSR